MSDSARRALDRCLDVALEQGSLSLGLRDYERLTGVSARMLVHYYGTKAGLEAALLAEIERRLLTEVMDALADPAVRPIDAVREFGAPEKAGVRALMRLLVGRAFSGDAQAADVLRRERERWRTALHTRYSEADDAEEALLILVGGAFDLMLAET
jgi:AcrR family transcriptional regulator